MQHRLVAEVLADFHTFRVAGTVTSLLLRAQVVETSNTGSVTWTGPNLKRLTSTNTELHSLRDFKAIPW